MRELHKHLTRDPGTLLICDPLGNQRLDGLVWRQGDSLRSSDCHSDGHREKGKPLLEVAEWATM